MKNECLSMAVPAVAPERKVMLTIEETCGVFGIGEHTIRKLVKSKPNADYLYLILSFLFLANITLQRTSSTPSVYLPCAIRLFFKRISDCITLLYSSSFR